MYSVVAQVVRATQTRFVVALGAMVSYSVPAQVAQPAHEAAFAVAM